MCGEESARKLSNFLRKFSFFFVDLNRRGQYYNTKGLDLLNNIKDMNKMDKKYDSDEKKKSKLKLIAKIILAALAVLFCVGLSVLIYQVVSDKEALEQWMNAHQYLGRLAYIGISMVQVIFALIPGEPVEIAGGYIFGAVEGTILYLIGASAGSIIVFSVVRKFGTGLVEMFFSKENIRSLRFLQNSRRRNILLVLIFILPGSPKDLLCYFAGLTDIKFSVWLVACSMGRLPSIVTSMLGGDALETESYVNAVMVFGITLLISAIGLLIYKGICKWHDRHQERTLTEKEEAL